MHYVPHRSLIAVSSPMTAYIPSLSLANFIDSVSLHRRALLALWSLSTNTNEHMQTRNNRK